MSNIITAKDINNSTINNSSSTITHKHYIGRGKDKKPRDSKKKSLSFKKEIEKVIAVIVAFMSLVPIAKDLIIKYIFDNMKIGQIVEANVGLKSKDLIYSLRQKDIKNKPNGFLAYTYENGECKESFREYNDNIKATNGVKQATKGFAVDPSRQIVKANCPNSEGEIEKLELIQIQLTQGIKENIGKQAWVEKTILH